MKTHKQQFQWKRKFFLKGCLCRLQSIVQHLIKEDYLTVAEKTLLKEIQERAKDFLFYFERRHTAAWEIYANTKKLEKLTKGE